MNIGVLGGTFDPIHTGHIMIAEEARTKLRLAKVLFVLDSQPWFKADRSIASAIHRVEMVKLAVADNPCFELSTIVAYRPWLSYSVETMTTLQHQLGAETKILFLLGWDSLAELHRWKEPSRLVQMCQLVAVPRPGFSPPDLEALESSITGITQSVVWLDIPPVDISSSDIRKRVAEGLPVGNLVPAEVARYIEEQGLYR